MQRQECGYTKTMGFIFLESHNLKNCPSTHQKYFHRFFSCIIQTCSHSFEFWQLLELFNRTIAQKSWEKAWKTLSLRGWVGDQHPAATSPVPFQQPEIRQNLVLIWKYGQRRQKLAEIKAVGRWWIQCVSITGLDLLPWGHTCVSLQGHWQCWKRRSAFPCDLVGQRMPPHSISTPSPTTVQVGDFF